MTASVYAATDMTNNGMILSNTSNEEKETIDTQLDLVGTAGHDIYTGHHRHE